LQIYKKILEKFGKIFYEEANIQHRNEAKIKSSPTDNIARLRTTDFFMSVGLLGHRTIALSISGSKGRIPI
jgi:hypothetical protein